jgi:hypothetical protein
VRVGKRHSDPTSIEREDLPSASLVPRPDESARRNQALDDRIHETTQYRPRSLAYEQRPFRVVSMIRILESPD